MLEAGPGVRRWGPAGLLEVGGRLSYAGCRDDGRSSAAIRGAGCTTGSCRPPSRTQTRRRGKTVLGFNMALSFEERGNAASPAGELVFPAGLTIDRLARLP